MKKTLIVFASCIVAVVLHGCNKDNPVEPAQGQDEFSASDVRTFVLTSALDNRLPLPGLEDREATLHDWSMMNEMLKGDHHPRPSPTFGDPSTYWNAVTTSLGIKANFPPPKLARAYTLVHVAIYDALISRHGKRRHHLLDNVVAAGAGSTILLYLFPDDSAQILRALPVLLQRDSSQGLRRFVRSWVLGRTVGEIVVDHGKHDNSDAVYVGTPPTGDGIWTGTNPVLPMAGMWRTWITTTGSEFQPEPPYPFGSHNDSVDTQEVLARSLARTEDEIAIVHKWADLPPPTIWNIYLKDRILSNHLNVFHAARSYAYLNTAMYDAFVSCWLTKYTYWTARPFQRIPGLVTVITTPNFPSYTSGHSTISSAAALVMSRIFPSDKTFFTASANEAAVSRLLGGIHFRHDNDQGLVVGTKIGRKVAAVMEHDGVGRMRDSDEDDD